MRNFVAVLSLASVLTSPALARDDKELQCNKAQTKCLTESKNLTIGDQVGVFNEDNELVAVGEVKAMKGERRAVLINKRHGHISRGYHMALLETNTASDASSGSLGSTYKIYREPSKMKMGAELGFSSWSVGDGSPATEMSVFAQWRKWGGMQVIARGVYTAMEGEVTHYGPIDAETLPVSVRGLGLLGGVGYILRETKPLSFRGELGVGGMYVSATADGDADLVEDTNAHVENGFGAYGRWTLGVIYNIESWHIHADFAQSLVYEAMANTIAFGVSKDIK
jgi:hypothetical protein